MQGIHVNYRYPIRENLLATTLQLALNTPISKVEDLLPKPQPIDYDAEYKKQSEGLPREE